MKPAASSAAVTLTHRCAWPSPSTQASQAELPTPAPGSAEPAPSQSGSGAPQPQSQPSAAPKRAASQVHSGGGSVTGVPPGLSQPETKERSSSGADNAIDFMGRSPSIRDSGQQSSSPRT